MVRISEHPQAFPKASHTVLWTRKRRDAWLRLWLVSCTLVLLRMLNWFPSGQRSLVTSQRTLISAFTLNYLDVDVEGMFKPGLDKKMVSILIRCYTWDSPQCLDGPGKVAWALTRFHSTQIKLCFWVEETPWGTKMGWRQSGLADDDRTCAWMLASVAAKGLLPVASQTASLAWCSSVSCWEHTAAWRNESSTCSWAKRVPNAQMQNWWLWSSSMHETDFRVWVYCKFTVLLLPEMLIWS